MNIRFSYTPLTSGLHSVGLCGDFSGWRIIDLLCEHGVYHIDLDLAPGKYQYKFVVDGEWIYDPTNRERILDPFGGYNSLLFIGDGHMVQKPSATLQADFEVPRWVQEGIVYQIFPDRFYNGDLCNDPDFSEDFYADSRTAPPGGEFLQNNREYYHLVTDWKDISDLTQSKYLPEGKPDWWTFYGGDIRGVIDKLDYLEDLGVTILYFNPLWKAKSNHKYDSADFMSIDPHFGTTEEMKELVRNARQRGMRIIVDVAFNHTGEKFWAFEDCIQNGQNSEWWNWYDWYKWPLPNPLPVDFHPKDYYQCWWGIKDMPDLNYDLSRPHPFENDIKDIGLAVPNDSLILHLLRVVRWWMVEIGIDGFRLDVPDEVPYWFWELFRKEVKKLKPDAWLVGEIWNNAADWVCDKYFDSVMNYAYFMAPAHDLFLHRSIGVSAFVARVQEGLRSYPAQALKAMMNLVGSHDTWRVRELCRGDFRRLEQLLVFQFTFVGTPHIYYGDEIGMNGKGDPDNRRPFDWDWAKAEESVRIRELTQRLISFRRSSITLIDGKISFEDRDDELLVFTRTLGVDIVTIVINLSSEESILFPTQGQIILSTARQDLSVSGGYLLPPLCAITLQ